MQGKKLSCLHTIQLCNETIHYASAVVLALYITHHVDNVTICSSASTVLQIHFPLSVFWKQIVVSWIHSITKMTWAISPGVIIFISINWLVLKDGMDCAGWPHH